MADNTHVVTTSSPGQLVTTVPTPQAVHAIEDTTFRIKDIQVILAIVVALCIIAGYILNRSSTKRKEDRDDASDRMVKIMDAIKISHDDAARDVRELTDKVKDGRTVMEKDIQALASKIDHERKNRETANNATVHLMEKTTTEIRDLDRRMTTQEEKSRAQDATIGKLEALIREKIDETKDLIKSQGDTHTAQFKELAVSIREARDAKFKA